VIVKVYIVLNLRPKSNPNNERKERNLRKGKRKSQSQKRQRKATKERRDKPRSVKQHQLLRGKPLAFQRRWLLSRRKKRIIQTIAAKLKIIILN